MDAQELFIFSAVREKASVASVDGDNGLGLVVGPKANEIAMDKAERHGSGWVSVHNTNHFGSRLPKNQTRPWH
jgi:LDH2 family malate/lactate/ureidoglycolate dehydrogenase